MYRTKMIARCVLGMALLAMWGANAINVDAAVILYGDFGPDFPPGGTIYTDVSESSGTDEVPLYGAPELSIDDLDFDPMVFVASATDGNSDITDGQLNFGMSILENAGVGSLLVSEEGDFSLFGTGTDITAISAGISVRVDILAVDGIVLDDPISVFASNSTSRDLATDGPVVLAPWENAVLIEFGPVLVANDIDFELGVTLAEVVIDNSLIAISEDETVAFVAKKDFKIEPEIIGDPIPEPASMSMLALGGLLVLRRR